MDSLRERFNLFMALTPLQMAVIKATSYRSTVSKLEHQQCPIAIIDATFADQQAMGEILLYLTPRLASNNLMVIWKSLRLLHVLLHEGHCQRVLGGLTENRGLLERARLRFQDSNIFPMSSDVLGNLPEVGIRENLCAYVSYLEVRITTFSERREDLVFSPSCSSSKVTKYRESSAEQLISNGTLDALFALIKPITCFHFFVDDLWQPVILESFQALFEDFLSLYTSITSILLNIIGALSIVYMREILIKLANTYNIGNQSSSMRNVNDNLLCIALEKYSEMEVGIRRFLPMAKKFEAILGCPVPDLVLLPSTMAPPRDNQA